MKKSTNTEINPKDWWIYGSQLKPYFYPDPACDLADHRFLSYLLKLTTVKDIKKSVPNGIISPITLHSHNSKNKTPALAIRKDIITTPHSSGIMNKEYYFGLRTYLVITTALAGAICDEYRSEDGIITINAIRPLIDNSELTQLKIAEDIKIYKDSNFGRHQIALLKETSKLIEEKGFIQAVIYLLAELNLDHSRDTIIKNGTMYNPDYTHTN